MVHTQICHILRVTLTNNFIMEQAVPPGRRPAFSEHPLQLSSSSFRAFPYTSRGNLSVYSPTVVTGALFTYLLQEHNDCFSLSVSKFCFSIMSTTSTLQLQHHFQHLNHCTIGVSNIFCLLSQLSHFPPAPLEPQPLYITFTIALVASDLPFTFPFVSGFQITFPQLLYLLNTLAKSLFIQRKSLTSISFSYYQNLFLILFSYSPTKFLIKLLPHYNSLLYSLTNLSTISCFVNIF